MTDDELLADIAEEHGPEAAVLVAAVIAGERGQEVAHRRNDSRCTTRGKGRANSWIIPVGSSRRVRFAKDPSGASQQGSGGH